MRKITALLLAAILVLTFVGCSSEGPAVATVNGEELSKEVYMFYLNNHMVSYVQENSIRNAEDFWANGTIEDMNATSYIKQAALDEAVRYMVTQQKAVEYGFVFSEENQAYVTEYIAMAKNEGEEAYRQFLSENFLTESIFPDILKGLVFEEEFVYHYLDVKGYFDTEAVRVKHVLIKTVDENGELLPDEEVAAARAKAEQVLADLQGGADFEEYIEIYGEDPGMKDNPIGYIFGPNGSMVESFLLTSLALEVDGISEIVESEYGYHIIKRYPLDETYYEGAKADLINEIDPEKYTEYETAINEAVSNAAVVKMKAYDKI